MNLPKLSFSKREEEDEQIRTVRELIEKSQRTVESINSRIEYLKALQVNIESLVKIQSQHKSIIDLLTKQTVTDESNNSELDRLINAIKAEVKR